MRGFRDYRRDEAEPPLCDLDRHGGSLLSESVNNEGRSVVVGRKVEERACADLPSLNQSADRLHSQSYETYCAERYR